MSVSARTFLSLLVLAGALQASEQPLLDLLVQNGTITREQADDVLRQLAENAQQTQVSAPLPRAPQPSAAVETAPSRAPAPTVVVPNRGTVTELRLRGRFQGQFAYSDGDNSGSVSDAGDYSTFELRRARLGVQGKILDDWHFLVEANVLTDTDLDSATLTWTGSPYTNVTFGKAKPQFGHEENTSSASILTLERSRLTGLFNGGKPLGLRVHGAAGIFSYYAGVYNGHSVSTSRMASNLESALWNLSGELNLDEIVGNDLKLRFRLDYLYSDASTGYYRFEDAVAFSGHFAAGAFDLRAEYMWGENNASENTRGFYVMPSYYFISKKLQGVLRYERISGDRGVSLGHNRYADRVPGIYGSGNGYEAFYVGINYYISGDNLKLMAGVDRAENESDNADPSVKGTSTTLISGIRMQF